MSRSPREPHIRTHRVAFVVYDGVTLLDVTGPLEVLHQANLVQPGEDEHAPTQREASTPLHENGGSAARQYGNGERAVGRYGNGEGGVGRYGDGAGDVRRGPDAQGTRQSGEGATVVGRYEDRAGDARRGADAQGTRQSGEGARGVGWCGDRAGDARRGADAKGARQSGEGARVARQSGEGARVAGWDWDGGRDTPLGGGSGWAVGRYETVLVSGVGGGVATAAGVVLAGVVTPVEAGEVDTVVVAGADHLVDGVPGDVLRVTEALASRAGRVASVCSGAFVLAALGLLDGRRATTHWRHAEAMARRYPKVEVVPDALHVTDGRYVTSAGISAGIDLTLALVEADHGAATARAVARELVVFLQRPGGQSQFSTAMATPPARSELMRTIAETVIADPAGDHSLPNLAASAAVSARHLTRLFQNEFRTTPGRWVERVRLDRAQQLLLDGHSITTAARLSGLGSDETLRRAFARHLGTTPTEYRRRFQATHDQPANQPAG